MSSTAPTLPQVIGVIPARLASTRLPRKMLREVAGKPLLAWVYQSASAARYATPEPGSSTPGRPIFDRLIIAVDSEEVAQLCRSHGWEFCLTSPALPSGTDRVHAVARLLAESSAANRIDDPSTDPIFVNIQGDEPLLRTEHFAALLRPFLHAPDPYAVAVTTVMTACPPEDIANPNVVKVVVDRAGKALYFSRASIPWDRDNQGNIPRWKHLGLYAYRQRVLDLFVKFPLGQLESIERLEQLRLLENGIPIHVEPVPFDTIGVDTEADLETVAARLSQSRP